MPRRSRPLAFALAGFFGATAALAAAGEWAETHPEANIWKGNENGTEYSIVLSPTAGPVKFAGPTAGRLFTLPDLAANVVHTQTGAGTANGIVRWTGTGFAVQDTAATLSNTGDLTLGAGYLSVTEMTPPGAGAANTARIYAENQTTSNFTLLHWIDSGGMVMNLTRDSVITVCGAVVAGISAGQAVYATGTATNNHPNVALAKADAIATMPAIGIAIESIANGAYGRVMQVGQLDNINTRGLTAGDPMYVSATVAGALLLGARPAPFD